MSPTVHAPVASPTVHATTVALGEHGVLIRGEPGAGKLTNLS